MGDLRSRLGQFADAFPEVHVAAIDAAEVDDWLRGLDVSPTTRNNFRRVRVVAFNYAVERGYSGMLTTPWPALNRRVEPIPVAPTYGFLLGWPESPTVPPRESGSAVGVDRWTHVAGPAKELPWSKAPARKPIAVCLMVLIFIMFLTLSILISERMQRGVAHAVLTLPYLPRGSFIP